MANETTIAGRGSHLRSDQTKEKLIRVAERLMGERGIEGVALREISAAAGQRNSNVIQYHFGDRLGLLDAIFEFRCRQIDPVRRSMMDEAGAQGRLGDIKTLLRLALAPEFAISRHEGNLDYVRLTIWYMLHLRPRGVEHPYDRESPATQGLRDVLALLKERLSFLPPERVEFRIPTINTMLLSSLLMISQREGAAGEPAEVLLEDALDMMTAAITAPAAAG